MKKLKHNKLRNTGIIFEILTRALVKEAMNNRDNDIAMSIIKRYFNGNTELSKELRYYQALSEVQENIKNPDKLIDLVLESHHTTVDSELVNKEKYRLIGEIKKHYNLDDFFATKISNYRLQASIYKLFEHSASENPGEFMNCRDVILEYVSGEAQTDNIINDVQVAFKANDPDVNKLAYRMLVEKFNEKYSGMNDRQKELLSRFINDDKNSEEFKNYVYNEVNELRGELTEVAMRMTDKVMQVKLNESINLMGEIVASNKVKDEHLSSLLKYYELVEELS